MLKKEEEVKKRSDGEAVENLKKKILILGELPLNLVSRPLRLTKRCKNYCGNVCAWKIQGGAREGYGPSGLVREPP